MGSPTEAYATFSGNIDQVALNRIFNAIATGTANGVSHVHLLFHSIGGFIGDGICLYNFLNTSPIDVTIYNSGTVQSIATIAYLGAKSRKVSTYATFMIHRSHANPQGATVGKLRCVVDALSMDDRRTEAVLRKHLSLSDEQWDLLNYQDLVFDAGEAVTAGIADEIAEFSPPAGSRLFNV